MMHEHIKMDGCRYSKVGRNEQHDIFNFYVKVKIPTKKSKRGKMLKKLMLNVHHFNVFVHHFYVKVKVHITIPTYSKKV